MTLSESLEIIYILQSNYPSSYSKQTDKQAEVMIKTWAVAFADYDVNIVRHALLAAMLKKSDFPPNLAEVNKEIVQMVKPQAEQIDGEVAWGRTWGIVRRYGNYLSEEQQQDMNNEINADETMKLTIRACGGMEGLRMCDMDKLGTLRAQFIRIYNSYASRKRNDLLLPDSLKSEMSRIQEKNIEKSNEMIGMLVNKLSMGGNINEHDTPHRSC